MGAAVDSEGYVYFVRAESTGLIKIGFTRDLRHRLRTLVAQSGDRLAVLGVLKGNRDTEKELHTRFQELRSHYEWFKPGEELVSYIIYYTDPPPVWVLDTPAPAGPRALYRLDNSIISPRPCRPDGPCRLRPSDEEVYQVLLAEGQVPSISAIQRRFRVGYAKAKRIKDCLLTASNSAESAEESEK